MYSYGAARACYTVTKLPRTVLACCVELNLRAHNHPSTAGLRIFASHILSDGPTPPRTVLFITRSHHAKQPTFSRTSHRTQTVRVASHRTLRCIALRLLGLHRIARSVVSHKSSSATVVCVATHQHPARSNRTTRYDTTADLSSCTVYYV